LEVWQLQTAQTMTTCSQRRTIHPTSNRNSLKGGFRR
jgi:hypothetical protein